MEKEQSYRFAECYIRWTDIDDAPLEKVKIALMSRERLGIAADSEEDNGIFYYYNGYEILLEYLAYGQLTQNWRIVSIVRLIR